MKKTPFTLVILAAGLGTRFGGLKQLHAITDNDFAILDFSIYDAIQNGAKQIIFIIRKEIEQDFKQKYPAYIHGVAIEYAFQDITNVPTKFNYLKRKKPWGTAHALLSINKINTPYPLLIINADDFYGTDTFVKAQSLMHTIKPNQYGMVGYHVEKTLSKYGAVSRGECIVEHDDLKQVIERTQIKKEGDLIYYIEDDCNHVLDKHKLVSMNFWILHPTILHHLESLFVTFLNAYNPDSESEFFLPSVINHLIKEGITNVTILTSNSEWLGITYKEDLKDVTTSIQHLIHNAAYPENLW